MRLSKKLAAVVATASLVLGLALPAFAAFPDGVQGAANRMHTLGLVNGKVAGSSDLNLGDKLTRAEAVTIIVRAFGQADQAKLLKGAPAFPDTANHWASGEIALAKNLIEAQGQSVGMPDGTFQPNGQLTVAQTVAFMLKFLGVKFTSDANWVDNAFQAAVNAGILTADDAAALKPQANNSATRGTAFYLADAAFAGYKLPSGKTVYQTYEVPNAPKLSVDAVAPTTDASVTLTGTVSDANAKVWVNSPATTVTVDANGKFSFTADSLAMGDTTFTFGASDIVNNTATAKVTVTRTTGVAATLDASDITVAAGASVAFAPVVKDDKGNVIATAEVTVTSDLGTYAAGQFTAGKTAGTGTATVTSGSLTKTVNVTVNAGALATLTVTPATADLGAGASQKFTVTGVDANGNAVAVSNVTWTSSKGVMGQDGTFGATADAAGTVTVTATAGSVTGTATINVFGVASKLSAAAPSGLVANGATTADVVVTVLDANGNVAKNYTGNVTFLSNDQQLAAFGTTNTTTVAAVNGVATATATAGTGDASNGVGGTAVISVSASGLTGTTTSAVVASQTVTSAKVTADPASVAADNGSTAKMTATLLDQTGNPMVNMASPSNYTVDFALDGTTIFAATDLSGKVFGNNGDGNAVAQGTVTVKNNLGTSTVSATIKKSGAATTVAANSVTITAGIVGVPYKLGIDTISDAKAAGSSGTTQTIVVRVYDVNGNQVTGANSTAGTFKIADLALAKDSSTSSALAVITPPAGAWSNGKATFTAVDTKAESVTYKATATWGTPTALTLVAATGTGKFVSGAAKQLKISASPSVLNATVASTSTLTAKVTDQNGNTVTAGSFAVTFSRQAGYGGAVAGWSDVTVNTVNGVATTTVTGANTDGKTDSFVATAKLDGSTTTSSATNPFVSGKTATITSQIQGLANQLAFDTTTYGQTAGDTQADVNVLVQDGATHTITSDNSTVVTLTATDADGAVTTYTATAANGVATFNLGLNTAGDYTLKATSGSLKGATGATGANPKSKLTVTASATIASLTVSPTIATIGADGTQDIIKVKALDAYGNKVSGAGLTNASAVTLDFAPNNAVYGALGALTYSGGVGSATFTAGSQPTTVTFTASMSGVTSGTGSLTTMVIGSLNRTSVAVDAAQEIYGAQAAKPYQTVTVTILDANGNRITAVGQQGYIKLASNQAAASIYTDETLTTVNTGVYVGTSAGTATFYVVSTVTGDVTYTATATTVSGVVVANVTAGTGTGTFTPADADHVVVSFSPSSITGNGSNISVVTAKVVDVRGNVVTNATGSIKFKTTDTNYGFLQNIGSDGYVTVTLVNGQASAVVQSYYVPSGSGPVTVTADYYLADGTAAAGVAQGSKNLTVSH